jgi:hypothetical protein
MGKIINLLKKEFWNNFALFLCGVLLIYIAAFDAALFQLVAFDLTNRLLVTFGTIVAVGVPIFFGIGTIKQSILFRRQTIFFYEKMLGHWSFWMATGILCFLLTAVRVAVLGTFSISDDIVDVLCVLAGTYIVYYSYKLWRPFSQKPPTPYNNNYY